MSSSNKPLKLSTRLAIVVTSFHAQLVDARDAMAAMLSDSLTKVILTLQETFFDMQGFAGVPMQWKQQLQPRILKLHVKFWGKQNTGWVDIGRIPAAFQE